MAKPPTTIDLPSTAVTVTEAPQDLEQFFHARARHITEAWTETEEVLRSGIRRVIVFGLLLLDTKERGLQTKVIKHGQFLPWLEKNCPNVPQRTAYQWMSLASGVLDSLQICNDCKFDDLPLHQVLQLPPNELPKEAVEVQQKVFNLVDGKSQKQLLFEFRDLEPSTPGSRQPASKRNISPQEAVAATKAAAEERFKKIMMDIQLITPEERTAVSNATRDDFYDVLLTETSNLRDLMKNKKGAR